MIRLKRLNLVNWCQFQGEHTFDLDGGLIGIYGPNGVGKSNLVAAVRFLLSGESGNLGAQLADVSWGAESARLSLHFEVDGTMGIIRRSIPSGSTVLKYGDREITSTAEAKAAMLKLMGLDSPAALSPLIVRQGELMQVAFAQPATREKRFHRLCGITHLDNIRKAFIQEKFELPAGGSVVGLEDVEEDIRALTESLTETEKTLAELTAKRMLNDERTAYLSEVKQYDELQDLELRYTDLKNKVVERREEVNRLSAVYTKASDEYLALYDQFEKAQSGAEAARQLISENSVVVAQAAQRAVFEKKLEELKNAHLEPEPTTDVTETFIRDLRAEISVRNVEKELASLVVTAAHAGGDVCPVCSQHVDDMEMLVESNRKVMNAAEAWLGTACELLQTSVDNYEAYKTAKAAWGASKQALESRIKDAEDVLVQMPKLEPADESIISYAQSKISELKKLGLELETARGKRDEARDDRSKHQGVLTAAVSACEHLEKRLKTCSYHSVGDVKQYKKLLEQDDQRASEIQKLEVVLDMTKENLRKSRDFYAKQTNAVKTSKSIAAYTSSLDKILDVLGRENLQRKLAVAKIRDFNGILNGFLGLFEFPFTIRLGDDTSAEVMFDNGKILSADRLSVGQKMSFAVSWVFSEAQFLCSDVGIIFLDEPTAYLDEDAKVHMCNLFSAIKSAAKNTGMQVALITHEESFRGLEDKKIELGL